ncbi:2OG-Fe(II) oxygenase family protein [Spirillospora sp. CA-255316]
MIEVFRLPELVAAAAAGERGLIERFDRVCSEVGAFALTGLELPDGLLERVHRDTLEFFSLPSGVKAQLQSPDGDQFVGWKGQADNQNEFGFPDRKEMFHIGPRADRTLRGPDARGRLPEPGTPAQERACPLWPDELPEFAASWHAYYRAMQDAATALGQVMAATLGVPPGRWGELVEDNWADLAANFYPAATEGAAGVRNAVHSDLTMFTILFQDSGGGGGLHMQGRDGQWVDVPPSEGHFLVNIGELLAFLTSGRWWAVPHEVAEADPDRAGADTVRISIPFFYRPNDARSISPLIPVDADVSQIQVGDWVRGRKLVSKQS